MAIFELEHLSFTYPNASRPALNDISLSVEAGEFILLCGLSGCGKTTLLRLLKPALTPRGTRCGTVRFRGRPLEDWGPAAQTAKIGYVMQSPDDQLVTDRVWHELAFGLESLGLDSRTIRLRTAEMASFFGMESWFERDVSTLSGGQKQLLNLASVLAMQPEALLLDEPTSQLDPIAAADFLAAVKKINTEFGVAVLIVEQRLEEAFPLADRVAVLDGGSLSLVAPPREAGAVLSAENHPMARALPAPVKIYRGVQSEGDCPLTVREGRRWLQAQFENHPPRYTEAGKQKSEEKRAFSIQLKECWFSYEKEGPDILRGLTLEIPQGGLHCILGGNGAGKTTVLNLLAGIVRPYRGKCRVSGRTALLPQNPQSLFVMDTVAEDLAEALDPALPEEEKQRRVLQTAERMEIVPLLQRHPYDLSGGEQQRAALGKVLLTQPDILLLDEPTKGLDAFFKETLAEILKRLIRTGVTAVMVSHDIEFCAEYADTCALLFNGAVAAAGTAREFFAGNRFYTTAANRMARDWFPDAVTNEDVIALCRKNQTEK